MKTEIVKYLFHGDALDCIPQDGKLWVAVKPVCRGLGIDHDAQRVKLKGKSWAVTGFIPATGTDGKNYETFCLDLDSLPMWLATIEPARVDKRVRAKLEAYQKECARVLRDHFFGRVPDLSGLMERVEALAAEVVALRAENVDLKKAVEAPRVVATESTISSTIGMHKGKVINERINRITDARMVIADPARRDADWRSLRMKLNQEIRALIGFGPSAWAKLPWSRKEDADRVLDVKEKEIFGKRRAKADRAFYNAEQMSIFNVKPKAAA